jgi:pimeloyl-ACP methyl ester carboxylesterase
MTPTRRSPGKLALSLAMLGSLGLAACSPRGPTAPPIVGPGLVSEPCMLTHSSRLMSLKAECATLEVPENPSGEGRRITLSIVRVPAISERKAADPLFILAGGPGMGAQEMYPAVAAAFSRVGRDRDIILLDQRGTGTSTPLACALDPDGALLRGKEATVEDIDAAARDCLDELRAKHDVRQYTTSVAVRDLETVREALGAERINLYGISYGTRVAQHYLRRHPDRVRSVVLDGVVPPGLALGPAIATDAEAALARIFKRCTAQPACRSAFGDPTATYRSLLERLRTTPREVRLPDPRTGEPRSLRFGHHHLAAVLRLSSYDASQAALLPVALHEAATKENFTPLASSLLMLYGSMEGSIATGMHYSVVCSEDIPFVGAVDRARLAATYMGTEMLDSLQRVCASWPRGPVDADFREPLSTAVPVLLLSGADDPVTPPSYGEAALRGLADARHVVLADAGHGQLGAPCMDKVLRDFIDTAQPSKLDLKCLDKRSTAPFFTSLAGPPP